MSSGEFNSPSVPFNLPIKLVSGSKVTVLGVPSGNGRFSVNFACGPSMDSSDIAYHFDVRFNIGSDKHKVVRNHRTGGKWGTEERKDDFPFTANNICEIMFKIKDDTFKVSVNDDKYCTHYCHIKPEHVTHLIIQGDIQLRKVQISH